MVWCRMVSNGVEWCGVKWCQVSVMTLESLVVSSSSWSSKNNYFLHHRVENMSLF